MKSNFVVYGSKGHAGVVANLIKDSDGHVDCFFDDFENPEEPVDERTVIAYDPEVFKDAEMIVAVGNNQNREEIAKRVKHRFATLVHPTAFVSSGVSIGEGSVVLANATIQANARIGRHVIITAGVCIDHDAVIDDFVIVYPNSYIGGEAQLKKGVCVGPGCVIMRRMIVAENETIAPLSVIE